MAGKNFGYYDDWRNAALTCPQCGWTGTFEQGSVEHYSELFDCSCPSCPWPESPILAIVSYPTIEESEQNSEKLSDSEREHVAGIKASSSHSVRNSESALTFTAFVTHTQLSSSVRVRHYPK
jgi:hypothetical protein